VPLEPGKACGTNIKRATRNTQTTKSKVYPSLCYLNNKHPLLNHSLCRHMHVISQRRNCSILYNLLPVFVGSWFAVSWEPSVINRVQDHLISSENSLNSMRNEIYRFYLITQQPIADVQDLMEARPFEGYVRFEVLFWQGPIRFHLGMESCGNRLSLAVSNHRHIY
jgi:hypothetical protein